MTQPGRDQSIPATEQGVLFAGRVENGESTREGQPSTPVWPGERQAVQAVVAEFKKLLEPFQTVIAVRPGAPDSLTRLETALAQLPGSDALGQMIDRLRIKATETVARARHARIEAFRRID